LYTRLWTLSRELLQACAIFSCDHAILCIGLPKELQFFGKFYPIMQFYA
jgi:hypothetical protein